MRKEHAKELQNLLNHIDQIAHSSRLKQSEDRLNQFGEFSRSLVSYIEQYFKKEDFSSADGSFSPATFLAKVKGLHDVLTSPSALSWVDEKTTLDDALSSFNQNLSRELSLSFPPLDHLSLENFNRFLDAFVKDPIDREQAEKFAGLRARAALFIPSAGGVRQILRLPTPVTPVTPFDEAGTPLGGETPSVPVSVSTGREEEGAPSLPSLAQYSPVGAPEETGATAAVQRLRFFAPGDEANAVAPDNEASFREDLLGALGAENLTKDHRAILGDLRIEKFEDANKFFSFLRLVFSEDKIKSLQTEWKENLEKIFTQLQNEKEAAAKVTTIIGELNTLLPAFVQINVGVGAGVGVASDLTLEPFVSSRERGPIPSQYVKSPEEPTIRDFTRNANGVLLTGHKLRCLLVDYEIELNKLEAIQSKLAADPTSTDLILQQKAIKSAQVIIQENFFTLAKSYFTLLDASLQVAGELLSLSEEELQFIGQVENFEDWHRSLFERAEALDLDAYKDVFELYKLHTQLSSTLEHVGLEQFYFFSLNESFNELETATFVNSHSLQQLFAKLVKIEEARQIKAITQLASQKFDFSETKVRPIKAKARTRDDKELTDKELANRAVLLSEEELQRYKPLPPVPPSRAQKRMPIKIANKELRALLACPPPPDSEESAETTAKRMKTVEAKKLAEYLGVGEEAVTCSSFVYANPLPPGSKPENPEIRIPFLSPELVRAMQNELLLANECKGMVAGAEASSRELTRGEVYATEDFLTDAVLHAVSPSAADVKTQLEELLLTYFGLIQAAQQLQLKDGVEKKFLILPILPFREGEAENYEIGAYIAAIATMIYRNYRRSSLEIILLPPVSNTVPQAVLEQIATWFNEEWVHSTALKGVEEFIRIDKKDHREGETSLAPALEAILSKEDFCWPSRGTEKVRVNYSPILAPMVPEAYKKYMENNPLMLDRQRKLIELWNQNGTKESFFSKAQRVMASYYEGSLIKWLGWDSKHNKARVIEFVEKMKTVGKSWKLSELKNELIKLMHSVLNDFKTNPYYSVEGLVSGSFMERALFVLNQIEIAEEAVLHLEGGISAAEEHGTTNGVPAAETNGVSGGVPESKEDVVGPSEAVPVAGAGTHGVIESKEDESAAEAGEALSSAARTLSLTGFFGRRGEYSGTVPGLPPRTLSLG